jgi:hypothetical protein
MARIEPPSAKEVFFSFYRSFGSKGEMRSCLKNGSASPTHIVVFWGSLRRVDTIHNNNRYDDWNVVVTLNYSR